MALMAVLSYDCLKAPVSVLKHDQALCAAIYNRNELNKDKGRCPRSNRREVICPKVVNIDGRFMDQ